MRNDNEGEYSSLRVMRSAAGGYVGRIFTYNDGFKEPGSRESGYFKTYGEAKDALDEMTPALTEE